MNKATIDGTCPKCKQYWAKINQHVFQCTFVKERSQIPPPISHVNTANVETPVSSVNKRKTRSFTSQANTTVNTSLRNINEDTPKKPRIRKVLKRHCKKKIISIFDDSDDDDSSAGTKQYDFFDYEYKNDETDSNNALALSFDDSSFKTGIKHSNLANKNFVNNHLDNNHTSTINNMSNNTMHNADNVTPIHNNNSLIGSTVTMSFGDMIRKERVMASHDKCMAELYSICDRSGANRYLMDELVSTISNQQDECGFDICNPMITKRNSFFKRMFTQVQMPNPEAYTRTLESGQSVQINRLPYEHLLRESFKGPLYQNLENLCINPDDPFNNSPLPDLFPDEIIGGQWYRDSYETFKESLDDGDSISNYEIVPHIIYLDGTNKGTRSVEPVVMHNGLLKISKREDATGWVQLGYIPDLELTSSARRRGFQQRLGAKDNSCRDYHQCLSLILQPLVEMTKTNPVMLFRRGDQLMYKRYHPIIAFFVADNKAADILCARLGDKGSTSKRMTRRCNTLYEDAGKSNHKCISVNGYLITYLSYGALGSTYGFYESAKVLDSTVKRLQQSRQGLAYKTTKQFQIQRLPCIEMSPNFDKWTQFLSHAPNDALRKKYQKAGKLRERLCDKILRKALGSKVVDNATFGLDFGANSNGIHDATPPDILHVLENGIIPNILEVILGPMTNTQLDAIDYYVEWLLSSGNNRSGEKNSSFPRVSFAKGFSRLTNISADHRVGQLFVVAILFQTDYGYTLLEPRFNLDFDKSEGIYAAQGCFDDNLSSEEDSSSCCEVLNEDTTTNNEDSIRDFNLDDYHELNSDGIANYQHFWNNVPTKAPKSVSEILECLDLRVLSELLPGLPSSQKCLIENIIEDMVKDNHLKELIGVHLPSSILDYRETPTGYKRVTKANHQRESSRRNKYPTLNPKFKIDKDRENCTLALNMKQTEYIIQGMLCYHALLKYGAKLIREDSQKTKSHLELLRRVISSGIHRGDGTCGWNIQKWIEMFHFVETVEKYCGAMGFNTYVGERGLKLWAKHLAITVQKRNDTEFNEQLCSRAMERLVLSNLVDNPIEISQNEILPGEHNQPHHYLGGIAIYIHHSRQQSKCVYTKKRIPGITNHHFPIGEEVLDWFYKKYASKLNAEDVADHRIIHVFTEFIPSRTGDKLRCHPNYRGNGRWYDFVAIRYEINNTFLHYPAKLVIAYQDPNLDFVKPKPTNILVQQIQKQNKHQISSKTPLFQHWTLAFRKDGNDLVSQFKSHSIDCIEDRMYCFHQEPTTSFRATKESDFNIISVSYLQNDWPAEFYNVIDILK